MYGWTISLSQLQQLHPQPHYSYSHGNCDAVSVSRRNAHTKSDTNLVPHTDGNPDAHPYTFAHSSAGA